MFPARNKKALAEVANSSHPEWFDSWDDLVTSGHCWSHWNDLRSTDHEVSEAHAGNDVSGFQGTDRKCVWYIRYIPKPLKKKETETWGKHMFVDKSLFEIDKKMDCFMNISRWFWDCWDTVTFTEYHGFNHLDSKFRPMVYLSDLNGWFFLSWMVNYHNMDG